MTLDPMTLAAQTPRPQGLPGGPAGAIQTLLVYERDGAPLGDEEGPVTIVAPDDVRSGPRRGKWLNRIEVRVLRG